MSRRKTINSNNYLDYIPIPSKEYPSLMDEKGRVTILQENKGAFHWLAQKIFHKPRVTQVHLDFMGNFIWQFIDGQHSVGDIATAVRERFGEQAEPLYPRLVQYIHSLESYGVVEVSLCKASSAVASLGGLAKCHTKKQNDLLS